jgi:hypothetical protein
MMSRGGVSLRILRIRPHGDQLTGRVEEAPRAGILDGMTNVGWKGVIHPVVA